MLVGDKVLVMPSLGENVAIPLSSPGVGDTVLLYSLRDETRIAVPTLILTPGSWIFNTPSFNFSGFNWNIDFNFQILPLLLDVSSISPGTYWIEEIAAYYIGPGGDAERNGYMIGTAHCAHHLNSTLLGEYGWIEGRFRLGLNLLFSNEVRIYESTTNACSAQVSINPNNYIYPNKFYWAADGDDDYYISFKLPRTIRIETRKAWKTGTVPGNIAGVKCIISSTTPEY